MIKKIFIDQDSCISCELCHSTMPELFKVEAGVTKAKLKCRDKLVTEIPAEELSTKQLEKAKEAADNCPSQSIKISEE